MSVNLAGADALMLLAYGYLSLNNAMAKSCDDTETSVICLGGGGGHQRPYRIAMLFA